MVKKFPEWIEYGKPWRQFVKDNLNRRGTTVMVEGAGEFLIGDINPLGGVCDDCMEFKWNSVVKKYGRFNLR